MKIICVGWNYPKHNEEMNRFNLPAEPTIFLKPDSSLLRDNKPFFIPRFSNQIEHEIEIVVRIDKLGKNIEERFAHRYYSHIALGVDFTARDLQNKYKDAGQPWELSKGFDNSAVISEFVPISEFGNINIINFELYKNSALVQKGNTSQMLFSVDKIIEFVSKYFTLKIGDLIYTGTPNGVGAVAINDRLEGYIEGNRLLDFYVK
ncbi:MAG: fumarylacetoacetate hydrolase family protein [Bacteroidales bacterium]|nr:fumarylacetoacetate hydrolase family protein [Bacteroidales bacterium]MDY5193460.1 fumarylacetoacetate hydrolase family protein [Candidatus Aphodosoma sp.]